jgi:hypothetical protein
MPSPQLINATIKTLLSIGPVGGTDATTDPFYVDEKKAVRTTNLVPNRTYLAYATMRGRTTQTNVPVGTTYEGLKFYNVAPGTQGILPLSVAAMNNAGLIDFQWAVANGVYTNIILPVFNGAPPPAPPANQTTMDSYMTWLFASSQDPNGQVYKFDQSLNATFWQIGMPSFFGPGLPAFSNGMIYGTGYYWCFTFANQTQESAPSRPVGPYNLGVINGPPLTSSANGPPAAPTIAHVAGGSIPSGAYYIACTAVIGSTETALSPNVNVDVGTNHTVNVTLANPGIAGATGFNTYFSTDGVNYHQQGTTNVTFGTANVVTSYNASGAAPPGAAASAPPAAVLSTTAGGTLPARTYYVIITYLTATGESLGSPESTIYIPANFFVVVSSPPAVTGSTGYNIYISETSGQETKQQTNEAIGSAWTESGSGLVLGQQAVLTVQTCEDPQCTTVNLYRIGGTLGQWLYVGSVANGSSTITDNLPDASVTGQALIFNRDAPAPFVAIKAHKDRMWGFGYPAYTSFQSPIPAAPSDLWYSNYNEPWGFDNVNQVLPVDDHTEGDVAVALAEVGSDLLLMKSKSIWILYGDAPDSFFVQKQFDIGCSSQFSVVQALGVVFWLSNQGIYMFDGSTLTYISKDIKAILDGFSEADFAASCAWFSDRMYWISFPTQFMAFGYDTTTNSWWPSTMYANVAAFDPEALTRAGSVDYVLAGMNGSPCLLDWWFSAETDRGLPINSSLVSRVSSPDVNATMRGRSVELNGQLGPTDVVSIIVDFNPDLLPNPASTTVFTGKIPRQLISLAPGQQGQLLQLTIQATTSSAFILESATVYGWIRRLYNQFG